MLSVWFFLLSAVGGPAPAGAFPMVPLAHSDCHLTKVDFIPSEEGLRSLNLPLGMMAASVQIESLDASGKRLTLCSASVVSDTGTILTAGHCLEPCLQAARVYREENGLGRVDKAKLATVSCPMKVNGKDVVAKVEAVNDCPSPYWYKKGNPGPVCKGLDYALLKIEPAVTGNSCFQVGRRQIGPGEKVASINTPGLKSYRRFSRPGARDTDGAAQAISVGEVIAASPTCDKKVDPASGDSPGPKPFRNFAMTSILMQETQAGTILQTTADLLKGGSGGGLADTHGDLVGIASHYRMNDEFVECAGSTYYTSTAAVVEDIKSSYPELDLDRALDCRRHAFAGQEL